MPPGFLCGEMGGRKWDWVGRGLGVVGKNWRGVGNCRVKMAGRGGEVGREMGQVGRKAGLGRGALPEF